MRFAPSAAVAALPLFLAPALVSCGDSGTNVRQAVFEQPGDVAFTCLDPQGTVQPLAFCTCGADGVCAPGEERTTEGVRALVTQTAAGEVAPVDLRTDDDGEVLDLDRRIPGFTFLDVGGRPSAIAVAQSRPDVTYVATLGGRELRAVRTSTFRRGASLVDALVGPPLALPEAPTDLVAAEIEGQVLLLLALPGGGRVQVVRTAADGGLLDTFDVALVAPGEGEPTPALAAPEADPYCRVCTPAGTDCGALDPPPAGAPRAPVRLGDTPRPVALSLGPDGRELFVADANLPWIHVIDLGRVPSPEAPPAVAAVAVAVPTLDVVATPAVPATVADLDRLAEGAFEPVERFLYAIDATDASVLAVEYTGRAGDTPPVGLVVPISNDPGTPFDRIPVGGPAQVLEVVTPAYVADAAAIADATCDPGDEEATLHPRRARGVFLAAGLSNGLVTFVDVFDLDAPCRGTVVVGGDGGPDVCVTEPGADDAYVSIRRHRLRGGEPTDDPVELVERPFVTDALRQTRLGDDGLPRSGDTLALAPVDCAAARTNMVRVFPDPEASTDPALDAGPQPSLDAILCARADPFVFGGESWQVSWEGAIPGAEGGRGLLPDDGAAPSFRSPVGEDSEVDFCARGVVGAVGPSTIPTLDGYAGDQLVLVGGLPPETENDPTCEARFLDEDDRPLLVGFPIERAFADRLELAPQARLGALDGSVVSEASLAEVRACFPNPVRYRVQARDAFRVFGSRTGFLHPIVQDAGGQCVVDPSREGQVGRVPPGRRFDNGQILFELLPVGDAARPLGPGEAAALSFIVGSGAPTMRLELGVRGLPSALRWLDPAQRLYVVDQGTGSLTEIQFANQTTRSRGGQLGIDTGRLFE